MAKFLGRFLCWINWHDRVFLYFHNFYPGDMGYSWQCRRCGVKGVSSGQPMW